MTSLDVSLRDAYLRRLGFAEPPPPTVESLFLLHRAQAERVPYESVWIWLGERRTIEPLDSLRYLTSPGGRGGYCYHLNGAFSTLLEWLGFDVRRHIGGVQGNSTDPAGANGNHLALSVANLPSPDNPDGRWFIDGGLGDGPYDPLPLRTGAYEQGPFTYRLSPSEAAPGGWRFDADPKMSLVGMDFSPGPATIADLREQHEHLQSSPDSGFVRVLTVFRRDAEGVDYLRGRVLRRTDATGDHPTELTTSADWFAAMAAVFGLTLSDVDETRREALWQKVTAAHESWLAKQA
jgi:arylamine N-acetyltransferase